MTSPYPMVPLSEVLTERRETPNPDDLISGSVRIVEKVSFSDGQIHLRSGGETRTGMILVKPGDLLVSGINAAKGAIAVHHAEEPKPIAATIHYGAYVPIPERVSVDYLWWLLRSVTFRDLLQEFVPGGIKTELKATRLLPIPVPLPPLDEQCRLVARIEELAAKIEEARRLRHETVAEMEVIRNSYPLEDLDDRWPQCSIEGLIGRAHLKNGRSIKATTMPSEIRCLTLSSLRSGRVDCVNSKSVPMTWAEAEPYLVRPRDVFIVRGNGSKDLVGRAGMVFQCLPGVIFPDLFIRVSLDERVILPEFFVAIWNARPIRDSLEHIATTTAGIWKINQGHVASQVIPLPPISEQKRIVARVTHLQRCTDAIRSLQNETSIELDALLPSILNTAFNSEL